MGRLLAAALLLVSWSCSRPAPVDAPEIVRILQGGAPGQGMGRFESYGQSVAPSIQLEVRAADGSIGIVNDLEAGLGEMGIAPEFVVYSAYSQGLGRNPKAHTNLRAIAVIGMYTLRVFVHQASGISSIEQLKGRRIGVPAKGNSGEMFARLVLEAHGLTYEDLDVEFQALSVQVPRFNTGDLDATIIVGRDANTLLPRENARVLPIAQDVIDRLLAQFPFMIPLTIPDDHASGGHVRTIGFDALLICRADLSEDLVYRLTKAFFADTATLEAFDVDEAEAPATLIPTHPGAARYYREREILN